MVILSGLPYPLQRELTVAETAHDLNRGALIAEAWQHRFGRHR
jgi:hypothetical protein